MAKKTFSSLEKVKLVLSSLENNVVITKFCQEHGVPRSTFYRWRHLVLAGLSVLLSRKKKSKGEKSLFRSLNQNVTHKTPRYRCRIK